MVFLKDSKNANLMPFLIFTTAKTVVVLNLHSCITILKKRTADLKNGGFLGTYFVIDLFFCLAFSYFHIFQFFNQAQQGRLQFGYIFLLKSA